MILVGDLNLDLDSCESERDMEIADSLATSDLLDMHRHFTSPGKHSKPATWHQKREGKTVQSRPDYFLCSDRRIIKRYAIRDPRHFATDHHLVLGTLLSNTLRENKCYLSSRTKFPPGPRNGDLPRDLTVYATISKRLPCPLYPPRNRDARDGSLK